MTEIFQHILPGSWQLHLVDSSLYKRLRFDWGFWFKEKELYIRNFVKTLTTFTRECWRSWKDNHNSCWQSSHSTCWLPWIPDFALGPWLPPRFGHSWEERRSPGRALRMRGAGLLFPPCPGVPLSGGAVEVCWGSWSGSVWLHSLCSFGGEVWLCWGRWGVSLLIWSSRGGWAWWRWLAVPPQHTWPHIWRRWGPRLGWWSGQLWHYGTFCTTLLQIGKFYFKSLSPCCKKLCSQTFWYFFWI